MKALDAGAYGVICPMINTREDAQKLVAGIHNGSPEAALERVAKGFQFVTVSSDARLMAAGAQQVMARMRASPPPPPAARGSY
jgi:4-hydroxy-2-oxoheptanedioate aldolase